MVHFTQNDTLGAENQPRNKVRVRESNVKADLTANANPADAQ